MARGSGDPRPDPSPFYEIRDSGSAAVDGRYERHHLRGYRGAAAYKKVGSAMTLYRWRQKMWILADLGPGLSKFGEPHAWYTAPCGSQDRGRVIQVRFNMSVPRARVPEKASTRRERSER